MAEQMEIPNWIVNHIGKLNLENELLKAEVAALRAALAGETAEDDETSEE